MHRLAIYITSQTTDRRTRYGFLSTVGLLSFQDFWENVLAFRLEWEVDGQTWVA